MRLSLTTAVTAAGLPGDRGDQQDHRDGLQDHPQAHQLVGVGTAEITAAVESVDAAAPRVIVTAKRARGIKMSKSVPICQT